MNEKLQYATMLEIPVNTCSVTVKPSKRGRPKRKRAVNPEAVKEQLVSKVNAMTDERLEAENYKQALGCAEAQAVTEKEAEVQEQKAENLSGESEAVKESAQSEEQAEESKTVNITTTAEKKADKKQFKFSIVGVQLAVIGVLIATIFLTNAFYADSGINTFMKGVFGSSSSQAETLDDREYDDFAPVIAMGDNSLVLSDGVMTLSGSGSIYASCNGTITSLVKGEDGKFTIEIAHSENFKSVLTGIDLAYAEVGDEIYSNIPVGYVVDGGATMCFTSADGTVITDYEIVDNSVVWAV